MAHLDARDRETLENGVIWVATAVCAALAGGLIMGVAWRLFLFAAGY